MIGFTAQGVLWHEDASGDGREWVTVSLSLDIDAAEGVDGKPMLDVRLAGTNDVIGNFDVEDVYDALYEVRSQLHQWQRDQAAKKATVEA